MSTGTTEEGALRSVGAVFTRVAATLVASALRGSHVQIQNASTPISVTHTNTDITITNTGLMCAMRSYSQIAMTVCMLASDQLFSAVRTGPERPVYALCSSTMISGSRLPGRVSKHALDDFHSVQSADVACASSTHRSCAMTHSLVQYGVFRVCERCVSTRTDLVRRVELHSLSGLWRPS